MSFKISGNWNGLTYEATISAEFGDIGIGSYEYWGARGVDSQIDLEEFDIEEFELLDEDGNKIHDEHTVAEFLLFLYNDETIWDLIRKKGFDELNNKDE